MCNIETNNGGTNMITKMQLHASFGRIMFYKNIKRRRISIVSCENYEHGDRGRPHTLSPAVREKYPSSQNSPPQRCFFTLECS